MLVHLSVDGCVCHHVLAKSHINTHTHTHTHTPRHTCVKGVLYTWRMRGGFGKMGKIF